MKKRVSVIALLVLLVVLVLWWRGCEAYDPAEESAPEAPPSHVAVIDEETVLELEDVDRFLGQVPPRVRQSMEADPERLVRQLIEHTLLLRAARQTGVDETEAFASAMETKGENVGEEQVLVSTYMQLELEKLPPVTETDKEVYRQEYGDSLPRGIDFDAAPHLLEGFIRHEREAQRVAEVLEELKDSASIEVNDAITDVLRARDDQRGTDE